ncbi:sugar transporter [Nitrobacter sp. Nb-311A]|uniref:GumC family protein n=1 Tax=Nitrobacter sp. Nb-311A TaxID=314253 RepID=UPI000E2F7CC0|nr:sugar transporter [Nitrobacter sp. Nb-311A]
MLGKVEVEEIVVQEAEEDRSYLLRKEFYWEVFKRRWIYFIVPFLLIATGGIGVALVWPPTYLAEGKILVQSQQIPSELVRATVTSAAQERIQVIQQRTMTRDNLIAIADKFKLFPDKRPLLSPTELVALIKKHTKIAPVDLQLDFKQRSRFENPTIVFSVGFEYEDAAVASQVANELMTRILDADLRDRTSRATDTTKFLMREVQKLQADNAVLDAKIAKARLSHEAKQTASDGSDQPATALSQLKAELLQKSAFYSDKHPMIQLLKKQIDAMEKAIVPNADTNAEFVSLDTLTTQKEALQKNLETATTKLAAARVGENLEKDQQSEKLETIEQPSVPQEPIKPNRPKVAALSIMLAIAGGAGLAFLAEFADKAIRRSSDIHGIVDSKLIVSIPYIVTTAEVRKGRQRLILFAVGSLFLLGGLLLAAYFFLPPLDLLIAKARVGLFR